jgi:excisionase family DNA binding protein
MTLSLTPTEVRNEHQLVFTSSQAARYLGVSLATIRRWTDAGHISCYRTPGGQRRFSREQLDTFITAVATPAGRRAASSAASTWPSAAPAQLARRPNFSRSLR